MKRNMNRVRLGSTGGGRETAAVLRDIAAVVKHVTGPSIGFALFLAAGEEIHYVSNAQRTDVVNVLDEWLKRTITRKHARKESSTMHDTRLELERNCAKIGEAFGEITGVMLFLFEFGDQGNLAYYITISDARTCLERWVKHERRSVQ